MMPVQYADVPHAARLHILADSSLPPQSRNDARFWHTEEGAMIAKDDVDLSKIQTDPRYLVGCTIEGNRTEIEKDAKVYGGTVRNAIMREGAESYDSDVITDDSKLASWQYNDTYGAKGGMTIVGRGCVVRDNSVLLNVQLADNTGANDRTVIAHCALTNAEVGPKNTLINVKGELFHSEWDCIIEGLPAALDADDPFAGATEVAEAWLGWGFRHTRHVKIGDIEFDRDTEAYIEGVFPNEIITVALNDSGEPVKDAGGRYTYRVWKDIPALCYLGWHAAYCSYDGKMARRNSRVVGGITGGKDPITGEDAKSAHNHYVTEFGATVAVSSIDPTTVNVIGKPDHANTLIDLPNLRNATVMTACASAGMIGTLKDGGRQVGYEVWGRAQGHQLGLSPTNRIPAGMFLTMPRLVLGYGQELADIYRRRGWDQRLPELNNLFKAILRTQQAHAVTKVESAICGTLADKGVFDYEGGRFKNWGINPTKAHPVTHQPGDWESKLYESIIEPLRQMAGLDRELIALSDNVPAMLGNRDEKFESHRGELSPADLRDMRQATQSRGAIGENVIRGKNVTIAPSANIGAGTQIGDDAVIGPGATVPPSSKIGAGTRLLGGTTAKRKLFVKEGCELSRCLAENIEMGAHCRFTGSSLNDVTMDEDNTGTQAELSMVTAWRRNKWRARAISRASRYKNDNIIGGIDERVVGASGGTNNHLSTRKKHTRPRIYMVTRTPDGAAVKRFVKYDGTNWSAGVSAIGTEENPIETEGAFAAAGLKIGPGARLMGFGKGNVLPNQVVGPSTVCRRGRLERGAAHDPRGFGFGIIARHGLDKRRIPMRTTQTDRTRADMQVELAWTREIKAGLVDLRETDYAAFQELSLSENLKNLLTVVEEDAHNSSPDPLSSEQARLRVKLVAGALHDIESCRSAGHDHILEGIRKNVAQLVGCYRMREGRYTEGIWVDEGDALEEYSRREFPVYVFYPYRAGDALRMINPVDLNHDFVQLAVHFYLRNDGDSLADTLRRLNIRGLINRPTAGQRSQIDRYLGRMPEPDQAVSEAVVQGI
ncbi:MAG: hypothetical protein HY589_03140 [Candidatus Omnitrophica bacterium]|nr:hypothetical protein [Candidatus Omnitrophota bacterium]